MRWPRIPKDALPLAGLGCLAVMAGVLVVQTRPAASSSEPTVWACGESLKVKADIAPQAENSVWSRANGVARLYGGRQEYVGFQVVVRAGDKPLEKVRVRVTPLKSSDGKELPAGNIDLYRQHYLKVSVPSQHDNITPVPEAAAGEYPVQMVPLRDGAPGPEFTVAAGRNQPVWVDLYIPEDQAPGDYRGEVEVTAGGQPLQSLKTHLTVWKFTLPRETHLKSFLATGPEQIRWGFGLKAGQDAELLRLEDRFFQMAHQHRLNFQPSGGEDLETEWGGRYRPYLDGSAFKERLGKGVGQNLVVVQPGGENQAEIAAQAKKDVAWWKRQGFKADLACYVYDEPREDEEFATVAARAAFLRAAVGKELPLFLTTVTPAKAPVDSIDIWGEIPAADVPGRQAAGQKVWATNHGYAAGPYVDTPGYAGRTQGWMAWKMKLDAWQFWDACYWVDRQNITDAQGKRLPYATINANPSLFVTDTWTNPLTYDQKRNPRHKDWIRINGDGVLFYPGAPAGLQEPLASFTMKSLRRGFQDYEYLWLLAQAGKSGDDVVNQVTPRPNEWARDPELWDRARLELGKRLDAVAAK